MPRASPGLQHAPTRSIRGQLTLLPAARRRRFALPVIGEGYAVPLANGVTLTGATYELDDPDTSLRAEGHLENLERVAQMLPAFAGVVDTAGSTALDGRVAFRCVTSDRMPMIGQLADEAAGSARRAASAWRVAARPAAHRRLVRRVRVRFARPGMGRRSAPN